jgi:hypothetical protein
VHEVGDGLAGGGGDGLGLVREVAADRAGLGLVRVGGADDLADGGTASSPSSTKAMTGPRCMNAAVAL